MKSSLLGLLSLITAALVLPVQAASRSVTVDAPASAEPGSSVTATIRASTDATDGEQIGFLHAEYSTDDGKTWTQFCFATNAGPELVRTISFAVGGKGSKSIVRARAAFRGGKAGDVDYRGGPIQWDDTWEKWRTPPTRIVIIYVGGR
jgi:hypothetical protein